MNGIQIKSNFRINKNCWLLFCERRYVIKPDSQRQKICELYFEKKFNCVCIVKELGVSAQYVSKVLKEHPEYNKEKQIRSEIKHKNYLERKQTES